MKGAFFLVSVLAVIAAIVITVAPSERSPKADNWCASCGSNSAEGLPSGPSQFDRDDAVAKQLFALFDEMKFHRKRAFAGSSRTLYQVKRINVQIIHHQSNLAASEMMNFGSIGQLIVAKGKDCFGDRDRVAEYFSNKLRNNVVKRISRINARIIRMQSTYEHKLDQDQRLYAGSMKYRNVTNYHKISATTLPVIWKQYELENRILLHVGTRINAKFPRMVQHASVRLGRKEITKAPSAALDGPFPIMDAALLLWFLYDVGDETVSLRKDIRLEVATSIAREGNLIVDERYRFVTDSISGMESRATTLRCNMLRKALNGLQLRAQHDGFAKRCD